MKNISTRKKAVKTNRIDIRLSDEKVKDLDFCAKQLNTTRTKVIESGIDKVKADLKK